jgi:hypothetical protein
MSLCNFNSTPNINPLQAFYLQRVKVSLITVNEIKRYLIADIMSNTFFLTSHPAQDVKLFFSQAGNFKAIKLAKGDTL